MTRLELPLLFDEPSALTEIPREPTRVIVSLFLTLEIFGLKEAHLQSEDFVGTVEYNP